MRVPHAVQLPLDSMVARQPVVDIAKAVQVVLVVVILAPIQSGCIPDHVGMRVALLAVNHDQVVMLLRDTRRLGPLLAVVLDAFKSGAPSAWPSRQGRGVRS